MRYIKFSITALLFASVIFSCGKKEQQPLVETDLAPKPLRVYSADGVSVNAYDFNGLEHFLKKQDDTTYVVNFWATWCVPCVEELPHFEKLNEKYKKDKVKVILVSLDMTRQVEGKLLPFIKERQLKSEVLFLQDPDQNAWLPKVDTTWTGAIPATVIYNKDKRKFFEKSFTYEELEKEVSNFK
ncbi:redoxin family protein [uncultured Flavobacterium sp.]|uniref:redoxin family protein n=1 Tax=uncultured Flavobacterium sp. TaxID=165435 RepID=UPI0025D00823|nr:redoxin family protein [uncultured Flavobacterium sp.]